MAFDPKRDHHFDNHPYVPCSKSEGYWAIPRFPGSGYVFATLAPDSESVYP